MSEPKARTAIGAPLERAIEITRKRINDPTFARGLTSERQADAELCQRLASLLEGGTGSHSLTHELRARNESSEPQSIAATLFGYRLDALR